MNRWPKPLENRDLWFSEDFRLTLIFLVAGIALFFVTPFVVLRFVQRNYLVAVADAFVVVSALSVAYYARRTGNLARAGKALALLLTAGLIVVSTQGLAGAFWIFPIILFVFYLAPPALGLLLITISLGTLAVAEFLTEGSVFGSPVQMLSFFFAVLSSALFSYAFAVRSGIQRNQLIRLATKDPLTDLYNRRALEDDLKAALSARARYRREYGMLVLDLDRFKMLNDRLGHAEGDRVLREFADMIRRSIRQSDRAYRYGGDEFIIVLPDADAVGLERVAEEIIRRARERESGGVEVRVSAGAAILREADDQESWNRRADRNLYVAKEAGGDRVVVDTTTGSEPEATDGASRAADG